MKHKITERVIIIFILISFLIISGLLAWTYFGTPNALTLYNATLGWAWVTALMGLFSNIVTWIKKLRQFELGFYIVLIYFMFIVITILVWVL